MNHSISIPSRIDFYFVKNTFFPKLINEYGADSQRSNCSCYSDRPSTSPFVPYTAPYNTHYTYNTHNTYNTCKDFSTETEKKETEKKEKQKRFLLCILASSIAATTTAFGLGRLRSSINEVKENIKLSKQVLRDKSIWMVSLPEGLKRELEELTVNYKNVEQNRRDKLLNYQYSLLGTTAGTGVAILGVCCAAEELLILGSIIVIAGLTFGAYQMAIHWDDFSKAKNILNCSQFSNLKRELENVSITSNNGNQPPFNPDFFGEPPPEYTPYNTNTFPVYSQGLFGGPVHPKEMNNYV